MNRNKANKTRKGIEDTNKAINRFEAKYSGARLIKAIESFWMRNQLTEGAFTVLNSKLKTLEQGI